MKVYDWFNSRVVTPCGYVQYCKEFKGRYCLHLQCQRVLAHLYLEACISETSASFAQRARKEHIQKCS